MNFKKRIFLFLMAVCVIFTLASCAKADDTVKVAFDSAKYSVKEGQSITLDVSVTTGVNYSETQVRRELVYSSSDESVATFVNGKLTGVGVGETEIKVEWSKKAIVFDKATVVVNKNGLPEIVFTDVNYNMFKGSTQTIGYKFDPIYTTATVEWESANPEVATVDKATGKVTAVGVGEATIIAYAVEGAERKAFVLKLTVVESDFQIEYVLNGGNNSEKNPAGYNTLHTPITLEPATRAGYKFLGWFDESGNEVKEIAEGQTGNVKLEAKWEVITYAIKYDVAEGVLAEGTPTEFTVEDEVTLLEPTRDGYAFLGWYLGEEKVTKIAKGTVGDVQLVAHWEINELTISYDLANGHWGQIYVFKDHADVVAQFAKEFNEYSGRDVLPDGSNFFARSWFGSGSKGYEFLTDAKYSAKWGWMLTLINDDRVARGVNPLGPDDGQAEARGEIHTFLNLSDTSKTAGYGTDRSALTFEKYAPKYLTKLEGVIEPTYKYTPKDEVVLPTPEREGYEFAGWYSGEEKIEKIELGTKINFELVAHWNAIEYKITYTLGGGQLVMPYKYQSHAELVADFVKDFNKQSGRVVAADGSDFFARSWMADSSSAGYKFLTDPAYSAKWGWLLTLINADRVARGVNPLGPDDGQAEARGEVHTFLNLSDTSKTAGFGTDRSGLKFEDYAGKYLVIEGKQPIAFTYTIEDEIVLPEAVREGYEFRGWLLNGEKVEKIAKGTMGDIELVADWFQLKDENALSYETYEGTLSEGAETQYLTSTGLKLTATAEKAGYDFLGWSLSKDGDVITEIAQGTRGDITLHAVYALHEYKIEYELNGGSFTVETIVPIYETFKDIVDAFVSDYATKYGLEGLEAGNFFSKSAPYGLISFWKDEALAAKWGWLQSYILSFENYSGINYLRNATSTANYNKYWRANLSAFLLQTRVNSPLSIDFTGVDTPAFFEEVVPQKTVGTNVDPKYSYTIKDLPLALEAPVREDAEFIGWCLRPTLKDPIMELPAGTIGDIKLYAKWSDSVETNEVRNITYVLGEGTLPEGAPTQYEETVGVVLPIPTRPGYEFLGWSLEEGGNIIKAISKEQTGDVTVYANWTEQTHKLPTTIYVDPNNPEAFPDLETALKVAINGDTIVLAAGTYKGIEITASITLKGANAGVDPVTAARGEESVFDGDILVSANNVVLDGIKLTGKARIVGNANGVNGLGVLNTVIDGSSVNSGNSATAPLYFIPNKGAAQYTNIVFRNIDYKNPVGGRPMFFYGADIENFTMTGCRIISVRDTYNDMFKLSTDDGEFGIKGDVLIMNNQIESFMQYTFWLLEFGAGTYNILNNQFANLGCADYNAAVMFKNYTGGADESVVINVNHNVFHDGYRMVRIDSGMAAQADIHINYNQQYGRKGTFNVKNESTVLVDATHNYDDKGATQENYSKDVVIWEPVAATVEELPEFSFVDQEYQINYELNGGSWDIVEQVAQTTGEPKHTLNTNANSNYWGAYTTSVFLFDHDPKALWAYKWVIRPLGANLYEVVQFAGGGKNCTELVEGDYVMCVHDDSSLIATTDAVRNADSVGLRIVIDGDISTGVCKLSFYDAANAVLAENKTPIEHKTTYKSSETPVILDTPVMPGKEFYGWYDNAEFNGDPITQIAIGSRGDLTFYARFVVPGWDAPTKGTLDFHLNGGYSRVELPTEYNFKEEMALPVVYRQGYKFLGWTLEEGGTQYITNIPKDITQETLALYANWEVDAIFVGADQEYKTIAEALAVAKDEQIIVVAAGTYDEDLVITTNGVIIEGANAGIAYDGTRGEETIIKSIKAEANNVVIDGVKLTAVQAIKVAGDNFTVKNSLLGGTTADGGVACVEATQAVSNLNVLDNFFNADNPKNLSHYRMVLSDSTLTNAVVRGNKFVVNSTPAVYIDCVKFSKPAGTITVENNIFDWPGDNFTVYMGGGAVAENTTINVLRNTFKGTTAMSGLSLRNLKATSVVNLVGNVFENVKGTVIEARGTGTSDTTTEFTLNMSNNALISTSTNVRLAGSEKNWTIDGNYFFQPIAFKAVEFAHTNDAASAEEAVAGIKTHKVTFVTNGVNYADAPTEFIEGTNYSLSNVIPVLTDYTFEGWYDNAKLEGEPVKELGSQKADVTLYAKFSLTPVWKLEWNLNGGSVDVELPVEVKQGKFIELPTPVKEGSTFLGWTLVEGGTDYVYDITVTSDMKLFANWTDKPSYEVTFHLNGGSIEYASRDALVEGFLADYSLLMNHDYKTGADVPTGAWSDIDYHTFFEKSFEDGTTVRSKWLWLAEYLLELSSRDLAHNNCNYLGLSHLINNQPLKGDDIYGLSYAFRAFLAGDIVRPGSSYTSVDFRVYENANGFWAHLSKAENGVHKYYDTVTLPECHLENYKFVGWFTNAECTGDPVTTTDKAIELWAKFEEANPVTSVTITNKITEIKRFATHTVEYTLNPTNAAIKTVVFESSNPEIATIDSFGVITAVANGKTTITVTSKSATGAKDSFELEVYSPDHFEVAYESNSFVEVEQTITLLAKFIRRDNTLSAITWESKNPEIATVDANGVVKGVKSGVATIVAKEVNGETFEFQVTVLAAGLSEAAMEAVNAHESNVFTRFDLGIGAGAPAYYRDIYGSVSKLLYNGGLKVDDTYLADGNKKWASMINEKLESLEFITIHYTGNMSKGATAGANAAYFANNNNQVTIHYVVGNDGVFHVNDNDHVAWHAGDGSNTTKWLDTGLTYKGEDLKYPLVTASDDNFFEFYGQKTLIPIPATFDYKGRGLDHTIANGMVTTHMPGRENGTYPIENFFVPLGYRFTVREGKLYMAETRWAYSQVYEGRICTNGGNHNSIGIESAVNPESDLWLTWQNLAQLVASLLVTNNLDIARVCGHNSFDGKDCPQPHMEHELEIWKKFIECTEHEMLLLTNFKDYTYSIAVAEADAALVASNGRVTKPEYSDCVTYEVTVTNGTTTEKITLASAVNGVYTMK